MRQSFLPGFEADVPFVLVDVELDDAPDVRLIGRLLDGPDAPRPRAPGPAPSSSTGRTSPGTSLPAFGLAERRGTAP